VPTRAYQTRSSVTAECSKTSSVFSGPRSRCSMIREIAINDTPIGIAICDARPHVSDWAPATGVQRSTKQSTSTACMSLPPSSRPIKSSKTRPRQRHEPSPFAYGPLDSRQSLASTTIKTSDSVARRQCASDRRERNMKTYQISDDRLVVVKKNLVVIKQKDSDKCFEFTPGRLVLCMFVTKYCISRFVCIGGRLNL